MSHNYKTNFYSIDNQCVNSHSPYRFGFNGQACPPFWRKNDNEVKGGGNTNTAEFWEYDTRLGRRWNLDPVVEAWISSYHAFNNNPIRKIDPNGDSAGDYYRTGADGKPQYSHSDENEGDGKVYLNGKEIPSYSDRQHIKNKVTEHLSHGPTFNEIGGIGYPITLYKVGDMNDKGLETEILLDAIPGSETLPGESASIDLANTKKYTPPAGYEAAFKPYTFTWHLHLTGAYEVLPSGKFNKISYKDIKEGMKWIGFKVGPTTIEDKAGGNDNAKSLSSSEFCLEPKNNTVYIIDYNGNQINASFDWFFNVQEGNHPDFK